MLPQSSRPRPRSLGFGHFGLGNNQVWLRVLQRVSFELLVPESENQKQFIADFRRIVDSKSSGPC